MRDTVLWRKESRIIMKLAEALHIDAERALDLFYSTRIYQQLSDPKYGMQLMSDDYIMEELIAELRDWQGMCWPNSNNYGFVYDCVFFDYRFF